MSPDQIERIKELYYDHKWSQKRIAASMGISQAAVSHVTIKDHRRAERREWAKRNQQRAELNKHGKVKLTPRMSWGNPESGQTSYCSIYDA